MKGRLLEFLVVAAVIAWVTLMGLDEVLAVLLERASEAARASDVVDRIRADVGSAKLFWAGGIALLWLARLVAFRRREGNVAAGLLVPAVAVMTGMGLVLLAGYYGLDRIDAGLNPPEGSERAARYLFMALPFAQGILWGCIGAALLLIVPWSPGRMLSKVQWLLGAAALGCLAALYVANPEDSARLSVGGVQLVEVVKVLVVLFLAVFLGRRAEHLRYQRERVGAFRIPRPRLLLPALLLLLALFGGLFVVGDLGPTLVLGLVFIALFLAVTHSWAEFGVLSVAFGGLVALLLSRPWLLPGRVETRVRMWREPWLNGLPGGDQLAHSHWALASGGGWGRGLGNGEYRSLPAGHTDLIQSHLVEIGGVAALLLYVVALLALVFQGLWIARRNRTPERMLLAAGLALLLFFQWLVIFGGTVGLLPLTGIVAPFLSFGKASMLVFLGVVGLLGRLAVGGKVRAELDEIVQVRGGLRSAWVAVVVLALVCLPWVWVQAVEQRDETTVRGVLTPLADGSLVYRHDPRVTSVARRIVRGQILDRKGTVLAGNGADGERTYPLGNALGTLLGAHDPEIYLPSWALEGALDNRLRGLAPYSANYRVWYERKQVGENRADARVLFVRPAEETYPEELQEEELALAERMLRPGYEWGRTRVRSRDYTPLLPLVRLRGAEQREAVEAFVDDVESRTVKVSLDAALQQAAARATRRYAPARRAAAVAVIDVDTGEVLARAQWPDLDPNDSATWKELMTIGEDPSDEVLRFNGSYGPWQDKTGIRGLYQAGSIFKLFTALAWVREGMPVEGRACRARGGRTFACKDVFDGRPGFKLSSWRKPIRDSHWPPDGDVEVAQAIEVSCNVFFGKLGLEMGPEPLLALVRDGLEVDNGRFDDPGAPGSRDLASTAFGQGAARMHVMEAARMVAALGGGGIYRKCPTDLELGGECEETRLLDDPARLAPILAGMRDVVAGSRGTARKARGSIPGVRLYGKTGTATVAGRRDEEPYGIRHTSTRVKDHSWFVALAEPSSVPECATEAPGRLAVAAVVPRGGAGSGPALSIVLDVVREARDLGYLKGG